MRMIKLIKVEMTAIYLMCALLVVSIIGFVDNVVAVNGSDRFPSLYTATVKSHIQPEQKTVYFTFDDGPSKNTETILDMLAEENIKATFFVTAQQEEQAYFEPLLKRIVDDGHSIGLHSYTHDFNSIYKSVDAYLTDINKLNDLIYEITGVYPEIIRFPGGSKSTVCKSNVMKEIINEVESRGYQYYDWHVVSGDDTSTVFDASYLADRMIKGVGDRDCAIVLLHDSPKPVTSCEAVRMTIEALREQGYVFDKLTAEITPVQL